jgi:Chromosome segregation protein Csm1/Pcs1
MPGISDLLDTDMEDSTNFIDENSILSSASEAGSLAPVTKKVRQPQGTRNRVTKPKAVPRKGKTSPQRAVKNPSKKPTGAKRKALEDHVNGQTSRPNNNQQPATSKLGDVSEDELESPKTLEEQRIEVAARPKGNKAKRATTKKAVEQEEEVDYTPTVARSSHLQSGLGKDLPKVTSKASAANRSKAVSRPVISESQPEPMETEPESQEHSEIAALPPPKRCARAGPNHRQDSTLRRRAGSASDTERGGDPNLRRKLGDVTRKFENIDLKYRNLKEVGISEANVNMEKLRKQCEATTAASTELIASLKKDLAMQAPLAQESRKLQKTLVIQQLETSQLRTNVAELSASLSSAQNEIKALQAKLAASRSASVSVESASSKTPGSALRNNGQVRTIMVGSAEAAQAAQVAQLKEDLYSDLTGLIVRGVKRTDEGDTYDCIQTGRNGSKWPFIDLEANI